MRFSFVVALLVMAPGSAQSQIPDHSAFDSVLQRHLRGTLLDYGAVESDPTDLQYYIAQLSGTDLDELSQAPRQVQLAFWINAYNACAIKLVIDHYPIKPAGFPASLVKSLKGVPSNSIRQIPDTWDGEFCPVAGSDRALDEIEHEIIRPMGEPRIHFAVNCASRSCPALAADAYQPDLLDQQLESAVRRFLADTAQYKLERGAKPRLRVNRILDWYKDDFGGTAGVVEFLLRYVDEAEARLIRDHMPIRVEYGEYDWTLNDTAVFGTGG